jgi:hypothetical protein
MKRNCVLIVVKLSLPDDVLFVLDRLINILLKIFEDFIDEKQKQVEDQQSIANETTVEPIVLRTAIHILNTLACNVHGADKLAMGALAIPVI